MHRNIELNRIVDMIIVIELNRETSADSHPYDTIKLSRVLILLESLMLMLINLIELLDGMQEMQITWS